MAVETHVHRAHERVRAERQSAAAKRAAYRSFLKRLADLPAERSEPAGAAVTATGGASRRATGDDGCRAVRTAFADTVGEHTDADGTLAGVREEFDASVAASLAPTTDPVLDHGVRKALLAATRRRAAETAALVDALDAEAESLADALDAVEGIVDWLCAADETPLSELGFEDLRRRHDRLAARRERVDALAGERQSFLRGATDAGGDAGVHHRELVAQLYRDFPVEHPVLATATRLDSTCEACQRTVREHLTRRA